MKRFVLIMLILLSGAAIWAQVPATSGPAASEPATAPSLGAVLATAPATTAVSAEPATIPSTLATASTQSSQPSTQFAETEPATRFASSQPTTGSTAFASTAPTSRPTQPYYSDYSRRNSDRSFSRRDSAPPPPATGSGVGLTPRPLSREYFGLMRRSIFIKGRQTVYEDPEQRSRNRFSSFSGPPSTTQSSEPMNPYAPENILVFNGASDNSGQMLAFIENTGLNTIAEYHVGDALAQGKVAAITLDSLDYQVGPRVTHVLLGQNLMGVDTPIITTQPVMAGGPGGMPTSAPASSGLTNGPAPDTNTDSVLERLRQRRLKELNGQ